MPTSGCRATDGGRDRRGLGSRRVARPRSRPVLLVDADIPPTRKANDQCTWGSRWTLPSYDRAATRALIKAINAATPGHVKMILFNDTVLIREGLTRAHPGHDDHLHLMLCEAWFSDHHYRC